MKSCKNKAASWQWFRQADELPHDWDDALPMHSPLCRAALHLTEQARLPRISFLYGWLPEHSIQVAFQVLHLSTEHTDTTPLQGWQALLWRSFLGLRHPKLLVAGHLFRHDVESLYFPPDTNPFLAFQNFRKALSEARSITGAGAVLVKEMPPALVPFFQHHAPKYLLLRNDASMQMNIRPEWQSFADYEKSLKHKYAQRLRRQQEAFAGVAVKELSREEVSAQAGTLYQLYRQVTDHQKVRLGLLSREYLHLLKNAHPGTLKVWAFYEGEQMIAFVSAWHREGVFDMFYIGFDYGRNEVLSTYFNLLLFSVRQAIALRAHKLVLGRTALEAKARMGAKARYLHTFLYIRNPLFRRLVASLQARFVAMEGEWENRHPFRNVGM